VGGVEYESTTEIRTPMEGYGSEGSSGGIKFGTTFGSAWDAVIPSITAFSVDDTPIRIVIECVDSGTPNRGAQ